MIAIAGLSTLGKEILQPKNPLNRRAIERIMRAEGGGDRARAGSSRGERGGAGSSFLPVTQTKATFADLKKAIDRQEVEMQGLKYWLIHKAAHDHSVSEALCARLNQIGLRCGVDLSTFPPMSPFPDQLS